MITKKKKNNQLFCARAELVWQMSGARAQRGRIERGAAKPRGRGRGRRKKRKCSLNIYN